MPIHLITSGIGADYIPSEYALSLAAAALCFVFVRAWASGPSNTRERKLHGRTVLLTGGFTPTGLTILSRLAESGAQVIALTSSISDPLTQELILAIQHTTSNELVFAEECDISSPLAIRDFCSKFIKSTGTGFSSEPPRLDAIIYAHEYAHIGLFGAPRTVKQKEKEARKDNAYATFLMTTLLLPFLLRSPLDRDIRIINLVNPYYAAAVPSFVPAPADKKDGGEAEQQGSSIWQDEGGRSLRSIVCTRHLQRILDAIASSDAVPKPVDDKQVVVLKKPSNISSLAVSPGFSRYETIAPFLTSNPHTGYSSWLGYIIYIILLPFLLVFAKSSTAASQTVLYALALPPPHHDTKKPGLDKQKQPNKNDQTHVLEGGKLYRDCAVVSLPGIGNAMLDDEVAGRAVWETFEKGILQWDKDWKGRQKVAVDEKQANTSHADPSSPKSKGKEKAA